MKKAFTLIELLIVVAIIAILAAIAVPNFLEAQTRAKISRVLSDQRAYATALETYYIDNNSYPLYYAEGMKTGGDYPYNTQPDVKNFNEAIATQAGNTDAASKLKKIPTFGVPKTANTAIGLTTPITYISTYVPDTFGDFKQATFAYANGRAGFMMFSPGPDGSYQLNGTTNNGTASDTHDAEIILAGGQSLPSSFLITGPKGSADKPAGAPGGDSYTYDATNGTASTGDVYRTK